MDKRLLTGVVTSTLLFYEIAAADLKAGDNPHTHFELPPNSTVEDSFLLSASGGQYAPEVYRLHLRPTFGEDANGLPALKWVDLIGFPNSEPYQCMYGRRADLKQLLVSLSTSFDLPPAQLEAIQRSLLKREETEIGGHFATRVFTKKSLWDFGMNFRPL